MFYQRVRVGEGPRAFQRRLVPVDVTEATVGQSIVLGANGKWGPANLSGGGTVDYGPDVSSLLQRVQALENLQTRLYVKQEDGTFQQVTSLWFDPETGDVQAGDET